MDHINKLEARVALWYKNAPHLPKGGQQWLADNIWWIVLVFVVIGSFGLLGLLSAAFVGGALLVGFGGIYGAALGGLAILIAFLAIGFGLVNLVIGAFAISPLKDKRKKGWSLLFLTLLISAGSAAIALLFTLDVLGLVRELLYITVGGYFLFEIREYFGATIVTDKVKKAPAFVPPAKKRNN
jgi:hypothetical protein